MEIDIAQLAAQTAALLAPYLPYLIKGGKIAAKKAFEKTGEIFAEKGWEQAEKAWRKLKPKVEAKPAAQDAIEEFVNHPEDEDALPSLRQQIKRILAEDVKLAEEISITIGNIDSSAMQAGDDSILIKGNVRGNVIRGNRNIIAEQIQIFTGQNRFPADTGKEKIESAYRLYLEKLRKHCNALPLAALGDDEGADEDITLDRIYIELDTTLFKEPPEGKSPRSVKVGDQEFVLPGEEKTPISVMEMAAKADRLVILGDAGAGKSTFIKKLLALQSAVLLGESEEPLPGFDPQLIPVWIALRELCPQLATVKLESLSAESQHRALTTAVLEKIEEDLKWYKAADFMPMLQEALENGKVLLALDGLDEVPQDLRGVVRQAVNALIKTYNVERILITSRSRSYTGQAVFPHFQTCTIAPFDEEKIGKFSTAWYRERHRLGHIPADQIEPRSNSLAAAATDPDLLEMSGNPMMLTSIALLHQREIGLPRERVRLYKLIVDVLISRWQKYKIGDESFAPSAALAKFLRDDNRLRAALEALAYEAHRSGSKVEKNSEQPQTADLSRGEAITLLERPEFLGSVSLASDFLDYVDQRAGLMVGRGGDLDHPTSYSFPHRTIQEYLAGCHLIGKRERERGREYYNHAAEGDFWSLAALMGAEELHYNRRSTEALLDLAYYLCSSDEPRSEQDERSALWSAQIACIVGKEIIQRDTGNPSGGSAYLQRLIPRTLHLFESRLTPRERAEAGDALAKLGDPRFDENRWHLPKEPLLGFVHIPAGEFWMGTREEEIKDLRKKFGGNEEWYQLETPQHKVRLPDYYLARYPVTVAQFKAFVEESGYKPQDDDSLRGIPPHPVVYVTWYDALEYCHWLDGKLKEQARHILGSANQPLTEPAQSFWQGLAQGKLAVTLPSEAEWEKAARGPIPPSLDFGSLSKVGQEKDGVKRVRERPFYVRYGQKRRWNWTNRSGKLLFSASCLGFVSKWTEIQWLPRRQRGIVARGC
ncbi:MAG: SUMF1/EgtB/PvdO family nonheme iron enzyme [Chloroflexota bacterium]